MSVVAETLGVSRSNLHDRLKGRTKPRRRYHKEQDAAVAPLITALVAARPTYGYRRITALLNRHLRATGAAPVNRKRVYRIMRGQNLLLARRYTERSDRTHNGKVVTLRSNLRWCSDGFEFTCWNGDIIRGAFIIDAHDREIIAWCAVANVGVSGSDVRDMMLEAVEFRFGGHRAPEQVEMLSDNGSPYIEPPRFLRRPRSEYGWSLWKKTRERTATCLRPANERSGWFWRMKEVMRTGRLRSGRLPRRSDAAGRACAAG